MEVVLYMATTLNGMIAKENGETPWLESEWESYKGVVKKFGNVIIGRKTYEIMKEDGSFDNIGSPFTVVVTKKKLDNYENFVFVKSPKEAIKVLEKMGFSGALVGGGGELNASFLKEELIDEIILDIEPMVFGKGIGFFSGQKFDADLEFIGSKKISDNEIQLHYKVKK